MLQADEFNSLVTSLFQQLVIRLQSTTCQEVASHKLGTTWQNNSIATNLLTGLLQACCEHNLLTSCAFLHVLHSSMYYALYSSICGYMNLIQSEWSMMKYKVKYSSQNLMQFSSFLKFASDQNNPYSRRMISSVGTCISYSSGRLGHYPGHSSHHGQALVLQTTFHSRRNLTSPAIDLRPKSS